MTSEQALRNLVLAWESLPGGRNYSPREIKQWLSEQMTPAINVARDTLGIKHPTLRWCKQEDHMERERIGMFIGLLNEVVAMEGLTWKEKRDKVLERCTDDDKMMLEEFVGWFEKEPEA